MADDISTTIHAAMQRSMDGLMDRIASDGLVALKRTLDQAGAAESLKQYEILSHVSRDTIVFEIIVDSAMVVSTDPKTIRALQARDQERSKIIDSMMRTFEIGEGGPRRVVRNALSGTLDARRSQSDARRPQSDARRRMAGRDDIESVVKNPRGMSLTKDGKLSLTLERSIVKGKDGDLIFPQGEFQGLLGDFMKRLREAIAKNFAKDLQGIVARHIS